MKIRLGSTCPNSARLDFEFPELDGVLADLPGLGFDLEALDKLLGLEPGKRRSFCGPLKNARARDMGYSGDGGTKSKPICGAKTRKGRPCQAQGNGKGGRCKLHGGMRLPVSTTCNKFLCRRMLGRVVCGAVLPGSPEDFSQARASMRTAWA